MLQLLLRLKRLADKKRTRSNDGNSATTTKHVADTIFGPSECPNLNNDPHLTHWEIQQQQNEYDNGTRSFELNPQSSLSFAALHHHTAFSSSSHLDRTTNDTLLSSSSSEHIPNRRRAVSDSVVRPSIMMIPTEPSDRTIGENHSSGSSSSVQSTRDTIPEAWDQTAQTLASKKEVGIHVCQTLYIIQVSYGLVAHRMTLHVFHFLHY